ncbi:hypothetical protein ABAC460_13745 [Asticcacaulis sp. AC460]|uniref:alginate export family protein n=1 Tax=Asticcacaulis sp. AC460 TaxID=1282360 RepID=UPI0003C3E899|nr:alginate export family protein [Asticcacaulis sp. AC460]ESQ89128.1 hypothetical protein ABAC460_13745 [Asticcacaulis sp. AC460]
MKTSLLTGTAVLALGCAAAVSAQADDAFKPIWESNLRVETVEQKGFAEDANAVTWRNRVGFQTGPVKKLTFIVELENTTAIVDDYNSTLNGHTTYPTVSDPEVTELNRAQVAWAPTASTTVTLGRQRIVLDDGRFVGNSGWRQDEQTFDALRLDTGKGKFKVTAAYVSRVNRVIGDEKNWNSSSYLLNASYEFGPSLKVVGFAHSLSFTTDADTPTVADRNNARASSVSIAGVRATGSRKVNNITLGYAAQYASESDGHDNPQNFRLEEKMVEVSAGYKWVTGKVNFESLGGSGTVGFVSPIGTAHIFQGWADAFSSTGGHKTFVNGINDLSYTATVNFPHKLKPSLSLVWHDYSTTRLDQKIGTEWGAVATVALTPKFSLMLKHADFERKNPAAPASRAKTWIAISYKY